MTVRSSSRILSRASLMVAAALLGTATTARAATFYWDGTTGNWDVAANWSTDLAGTTNPGAAPLASAADALIFNSTPGASASSTLYLNGTRGTTANLATLTFNTSGATTLLGGVSGTAAANDLFIAAGGITLNSGSGAVTIGDIAATPTAAVNLKSVSSTFTNNSSSLLTLANGLNSTGTGGSTTFTFTGSGNIAAKGVIGNGTGTNTVGVTKTGAGTLTLSAINTYTAGTTVSAGTLVLGHATNTLADAGAVTVNGGILDLGANSDTVGAVALSAGSITGSGTLTGASYAVSNATGTTTISAKLGGAGTLTKTGAGTLTLNNSGSKIGLLTLSGGVIDLAADLAVGNTLTSGNGFNGTGGTINTSGGKILLEGGATGNGLDWNSTGTVTINAVIANGAGAFNNVDFYNSGTFVLKGANTYTGGSGLYGTLVQIGVDSVGTPGAITSGALGTGAITFNAGARLSSDSTTVRTILNAIVFNSDVIIGDATNTGKLTFSGTANLGTAGRTITANSDAEFSGVVSNTGALTKLGTGTLTLSGVNTNTGAMTVSAGTLTLSGTRTANMGAALTVGNAASTATLNIQGNLPMNGQSLFVGFAAGSTGTVNHTAGTLSFASGNALLIGNTNASASSGTYNLSGGTITTYNSATRGVTLGVNNGALGAPISATFNLSSGTLNNVNGTLMVVRSDAGASYINALYNQTGGTSTNASLTIGGNGINGANSTAAFSVTGGTFSATAFGSLSAGNAVTSTMTIGGTAVVTLPAFPTGRGTGSTATLNFDGGTLKPSGSSTAYLGGLTNAFIKSNGAQFDTNTYDITVSQNLLADGAGGLTKIGTGTLTLSGANTYTGVTTVNAGTLSVSTIGNGGVAGNLGAASNVAANLVLGGGTLQYTGSSASTDRAFTLTDATTSTIDVPTAGTTLTISGSSATTTGALTKTGAGVLALSGTNTYSGGTTVSAGTLMLGANNVLADAGAVTVSGTGTLDLNGKTDTIGTLGFAPVAGSTTTVTSGAGTLTLGGDVTFTAATTGQAQISGNLALGGATRTFTVASGTGANYDLLVDAGISSSGSFGLTKAGAGTLTLSGANTYTGVTTVSAGTLQFVKRASLYNATTASWTAANLKVASGGTLTFSVGGTGEFTTSDVTTLLSRLGGANGGTAGGLASGAALAFDPTNATGAFVVSNNIANTTGTGGGAIGLTKSGNGTLTVSGTNTYTGATTINSGALAVGSATAFTNKGALVLSGTGTFDLNGYNASFSGVVPAGAPTTTITDNSAGTGTSVLTFNQTTNTNVTTASLITDGATRAVAIAFTNSNAAQTFTNANNTFSGGLTLLNYNTGGTRMQIGAAPANTIVNGVLVKGPYGTGTITIGQTAADKAGIYINANNATIANAITVNTAVGTDVDGALRVDATGVVFSGTITAQASDVQFGSLLAGGGAAKLTGKVTGPSGLRIANAKLSGASNNKIITVTLQGAENANDYLGATTLDATYGILSLGANNQIPNGVGKGDVLANGKLQLQGFSDTINGLTGSGVVTTTVAGASVLTLGDEDTTASFTGAITQSAGTVAITKIGAGTQTLGGVNTYTGATTVNEGTLTLNRTTGSLSASSALTVGNGIFNFDNTGATAALTQSLGALTFVAGDGIVRTTRTATTFNEALTFASLATRSVGATGNFINGGGTNSATNGFVITALGTTGAFLDKGVYYGGNAYAWNDAAGYVRGIAYGTDAGTATSGATTSVASATYQQITGAVSAQTSATFTTLNISGNNNLTLAAGQTLTVDGILKSGNVAGGATISGGTGLQTASAAAELVIRADGANDTLTISSPILANGNNALTKSGAGTLVLGSTANAYTGKTYVNDGVLQIANADTALGIAPATVVADQLTLTDATLRFTGATTLSANRGITISGALATFDTQANSPSIAGAITGDAGLAKVGASGTLTLTGTNTYAGATTVTSGTLSVSADTNLGTGSAISLGGGTLQLTGTSAFSTAKTVTLTANSGIDVTNTLGATIGQLTGAFQLTKTGAGKLTLSGASNTLKTLVLNVGELDIGSGNLAISNTTGATIQNASTTPSATTVTISATGGGYLTLNQTGTTDGPDIGAANGSTLIISAPIRGTSAFESWYQSGGSGIVVLSGTNTYTGSTIISSGVLSVANIGNSGSTTSNLGQGSTISFGNSSGGSTLQYTGSGETTNRIISLNGTTGGATIDHLGTGLLKFTSNLATTGNGNKTVTLNVTDAGSGEISGAIINSTGTTGVTKNGAGVWTLSGANTYTGTTTVNAGTLLSGGASAFTNKGALAMTSTGVFDLGGFNAAFTTLASVAGNTITNSATGTAASNATAPGTPSGTGVYVDALTLSTAGQTVAAKLTDGTVRETQLIINNAVSIVDRGGLTNTGNTFSGGLVLANNASGTRLRINTAITGTPFGSGPIIIGQAATDKAQILIDSAAAVTLANDIVVNTALGSDVAGAIRIDTAGHVLSGDITGNLAPVKLVSGFAAGVTLSGVVSGTYGLNVEGVTTPFTTTLSGANTYSGGTTITTATLKVSSDGNLGAVPGSVDAANIVLNGGILASTGTFTLSSNRGIVLGSSTASTGGTIDVASAQTLTYGGVLANNGGTNSLTKTGTGTLTLTGSNTYTGGTTVNAGTLLLGQATNTLADTGAVTVGGGTLDLGSNSETVGAVTITAGTITTGTLTGSSYAVQAGTVSAVLAGSGIALTKSGAGTVTLSGVNTYTGVTSINAGILSVASIGNGGVAGNLGQATSAAANLVLGGGTLQYTGATDSSDRAFTLTAGTSSTIEVSTSGSTLTLAGSAPTTTGALIKTGAGTLTLSGASTFTGGVTVSGGTLVLASTNALSTTGVITLGTNGSGTLRFATDTSVSAYKVATSSNNPSTIVSDRATAGAGFTHTLGTAAFGNNTYTFSAGSNVTSGTAGIQFSTLDLSGGGAGTTTLTANTANLIFTGGASIATGNFAKTLALTGTATGNAIQGVIANGLNTLTLTKTGAGTWTLGGANTYTGITTINAGVLSVSTINNGGVAGGLGQASATATNLVLGGGTLQYTGATASTDRAFTLTAGTTSTIEVTQSANTLTMSGAAAATTGGLTKTGAGKLILSNAANNYTGVTTINAGTLSVGTIGNGGVAGNLGKATNAAANLVLGGGTLQYTGATASTDRAFTLTDATNSTIDVTTAASVLTISGASATTTGALTKAGAGILTLTGSNVYSGGTTLSAGTLRIGVASVGSVGSVTSSALGTGALTIGGGTLSSNSTTARSVLNALSITGNATLGDATNTGKLTFGAAVDLGTAARTLTVASDAQFDGVISGTGAAAGITKAGTGVLTLAGVNTYTGITTINAGTLSVGTIGNGGVAGNLGQATNAATNLVLGGGKLQYTGATASSNRAFTLTAGTTSTVEVTDAAANLTLSGATSTGTTGALTKTGSGTLTLTGASTNTGINTISAGTLVFQNTYAATSSAISSGAVLELNVASGSRPSNTTSFTGAGTLRKTGAGTVYWGSPIATFALGSGSLIDVQGGIFTGGSNANEVWTNNLSDLNVASGATFATVEANVKVNKITGTGTITTGYGGSGYLYLTIGVDNGSSTFSGVIANGNATGNLVKTGSGTITLAGNNTYTGVTTIGAGTLSVGTIGDGGVAGNLGQASNAAANLVLGGGTLKYTGLTASTNRAFTLTTGTVSTIEVTSSSAELTMSGASAATTGGLTKTGNGTLKLSGANNHKGLTRVDAGTLKLANGLALQSSAFDTAGTGTLDLTSVAEYTFGGLTGSRSLAVSSNVTSLTLSPLSGQQIYNGDLSGGSSLALVKTGGGVQTLGGTNTYAGATTVSEGELRLASSGALNGTSGASVASGATLSLQGGGLDGVTFGAGKTVSIAGVGSFGALSNYSGSSVWAGDVTLAADRASIGTRSGALTVSGSIGSGENVYGVLLAASSQTDTITLSGASTYLGDTVIAGVGTVRLGRSDSLPTTTNLVLGDAGVSGAFDLNGFDQQVAGLSEYSGTQNTIRADAASVLKVSTPDGTGSSYSGYLSGSGLKLVKSGLGDLMLTPSGTANDYAGGTTVEQGTLTLAASEVLPDAGAVTVTGGALVLGANTDTVGVVTLDGGSVTGTGTLISGSDFQLRAGTVEVVLAGLDLGVGLTKTGAGTATLAGANTYTGLTTVSDGRLVVASGGSLATSGVRVDGAGARFVYDNAASLQAPITLVQGTLTGAGVVGTVNASSGVAISNNDGVAGAALRIRSLTLAGVTSLDLYGSADAFTPALFVTLGLTNNASAGQVVLTARSATGWTDGAKYDMLSVTKVNGQTLTSASQLNFGYDVRDLSLRQRAAWGVAAGKVSFTVSNAGYNPYWTAGSGQWNTTAPANWRLPSDSSTTSFLPNDAVRFDDNAGGTGTVTIDVDAAHVSPASTVFANSSRDYVVGGAYGIATGTVTKTGTGTVTLSGANTYEGATTVSGGKLIVSSLGTGAGASSLGSSALTSDKLLLNGAVTLEYAGAGEDTARGFTVTGTGLTLSSTGAGAVKFTADSLMAFAADGAGTRALNLGGTNTGDNTFASSLSGNTDSADLIQKVTKDGAGTWILGGSANRFRGDLRVDVNGGVLGLESGAVGTTGYAGDIAVKNGATLRWEAGNTDDLSGRLLLEGGSSVAVSSGTVSFGSTLRFSQSGAFGKSGAGTLTLDAAQSFAGFTVNDGQVTVNNSQALGSGTTSVNGGLLKISAGVNVSNAIEVNSGGVLGGKGSTGAITVNSGGTVSPGASPGILTSTGLTLAGGSTLEWQVWDATGAAGIGYDQLVVNGALSLTGTSKINLKVVSLPTADATSFGNAVNFNAMGMNHDAKILSFVIARYASINLGSHASINDAFQVDLSQFRYTEGTASTAGLWSLSYGDGVVTLTAVPEPSTYGLGLGALALAAAAIRRRRKSKANPEA